MISAKHYQETLLPALKKELGCSSVMAVPKLVKVSLNMGVGAAVQDKKVMQFALDDLAAISAQKPVITLSRKSEAGFKIREGWPIGCRVTLRNDNMYKFLQRFIAITCPRIRDFQGFSVKSFDGRGNFSYGVKEQIVFNEIRYEQIDTIRGLDMTIVTSATNDADALALLQAFGFPFYNAAKKVKQSEEERGK